MFTVCPKCTLTLVVTTVDLRAGQGYVRCGRCANVFNALIALREGDPASGGVSDTTNRRLHETEPPPSTQPALGSGIAMDLEPEPEPEPEPEEQPEPEAERLPEEEILLDPEALLAPRTEPEVELEAQPEPYTDEASLEFDAEATDVSDIFVSPLEGEQSGSGTYETVVLGEEAGSIPDDQETLNEDLIEGFGAQFIDDPKHTDTITASEWSLLDDETEEDSKPLIEEPLMVVEETAANDDPHSDPAWVEQMFAEAEAEVERSRTSERETLAPGFAANDDDTIVQLARASTGAASPTDTVLEPMLVLAPPPPARPTWQYSAGVAGLSLALLLQLVHFNRQSLVLNNTVGPVVSKIYGWFGAAPTPRWDLSAYTVKQSGAEAEGGEGSRLRVRLSLQNGSERVQPLPLLRLTLLDRFGHAVATRDLEPKEYLPQRAAEQRLLEPDQRIDAELHVIDPGRAASSFEIDACLRGETGAIGCANDVLNPPAA